MVSCSKDATVNVLVNATVFATEHVEEIGGGGEAPVLPAVWGQVSIYFFHFFLLLLFMCVMCDVCV